jgi:hypothetical protein
LYGSGKIEKYLERWKTFQCIKEEVWLKPTFKLLIIFLVFIFVLEFYFFGFTYDVECPKCDGTGQIWDTWYDFKIETWVTGYRTCPTCRGSGKIYVYTSATFSIAFFLSSVVGFLALFGLDYGVTAFRLDMNPWVKDVKEMHFWFNPMYFVWLFQADRKKWVKWTTALSLISTLILIPAIAIPLTSPPTPTTGKNVFIGWLVGTILTVPVAIAWYRNFEVRPGITGETPTSFLKRCVKCGKMIPIASEECQHCGTRQPE